MFGKIDTLFKKWDTTKTPGCSVGIISEGKFLYKKGYGLSDIPNKTPNTPKTIFEIASVSKQFTAACIALLHTKEELSINHTANEYLPKLEIDQRIKIKHLIYHESGLKDFIFSLIMLNYSWDEIEKITAEQLVDFLGKIPELDFLPGSQHSYTNTNYFLLGRIVKNVSGKTLPKFAEEELFSPLGMKDTSFEKNFENIIGKKALGYTPIEHEFKESVPKAQILGPRGVFTTIEDLLKWDQNFYSYKVGGKEFIELLEKPSREKIIGLSTKRWKNEKQNQGYAFGLLTDYYRGLRIIRHGGDFAGYTAEMLRFPKKQLTTIVLSNCSGINPTTSAFKVADVILENKTEISSPYCIKPKIEIKNNSVVSLEGTYYKPEYNTLFSISISENKVILENDWQSVELKSLTEDTFAAQIDYSLLLLYQKENSIIIETEFYNAELPKVNVLQLEDKQLTAYTGQYYNEKFDEKIQIDEEEEQLKFKLKIADQFLKPISPDIFRNGSLQLEYIRKNDEITEIILNTAGAKNIRFRKI